MKRSWTATPAVLQNKPTLVYCLHNPSLLAVKCGITHARSSRLQDFADRGWHVRRAYAFPTRDAAEAVERAVLRRVKQELGLRPYLSENRMRGTGGHTETFRARELPWESLDKIIRAELAKQGHPCQPLAAGKLPRRELQRPWRILSDTAWTLFNP